MTTKSLPFVQGIGLFLLLLLPFLTLGQSVGAAPDSLYWQNRKPHAAYWQQDVAYTIDAIIDENTHQINATESLVYKNNSPDTLGFVFFHLFQNAFIKGSYTHELEQANQVKPRLGAYEAAGLGITIEDLLVDGQVVKTVLDNTILKVFLPSPLLPGQSVTFSMKFNTYFDRGGTRRRMQMYDAWGFMHYNGCQWFPKISVYDAKFGWDTYQHLGKEFYGDFGSYTVSLDFASNYIVEATGVLQNRATVLPPALREQLDVKHFAEKPWNEPPSVVVPYQKGQRKKWQFHADHVHDFAFTADPSYRLSTDYWNGVECVGIVQEPHASGWQNTGSFVAQIIKTFSENYGSYPYPKMVAADANDGMEYPMITMDGGRDPGYKGLLVHEIAHNWFYGIVGSNETYRAAMDEGFTQFLTADGMIRLTGDVYEKESPSNKWRKLFQEPRLIKDARVFNAYISDAATGSDHQLNTQSDDFNSALGHGGGYRLVYYKTATMLYNLQYVLGDSLFQQAMKHYVQQWKFAHPYFEDFRNTIINFTHVDLNWFFDQWFETTKSLDYGIGKIKKIRNTDSFELLFRRKGEMQMPIDFTITTRKGTTASFHIPNSWFEKQTAATILPRWIGWGKLNRNYRVRVEVPDGIKEVTIDTSKRLADRMMLNNYRSRGSLISPRKIKVRWDGGLNPPLDWKHYRAYVRPDVWYNAIDGLKAGVHFEGAFLQSLYKINGTIWWNTQAGQWNKFQSGAATEGLGKWLHYAVSLTTPISHNLPGWGAFVHSRFLDGLWWHQLGMQWEWGGDQQIQLWGQMMYRNNRADAAYLLYPQEWSSYGTSKNTTINARYRQNYRLPGGAGSFVGSVRAPIFSDAFSYNYAQLEWLHTHVWQRLLIRTRLFGRYGLGRQVPNESALFLAGANPEEMMENKYVRSQGFIPDGWTDFSAYGNNHFHYGGGLNMRGYSGYYAFDQRVGTQYVAYKGRSGAALNLEVDFTNYAKWQPAMTRQWLGINLYAFFDAGVMELSSYANSGQNNPLYTETQPTSLLSDLRLDVGIGAAVTIKKWGVFDKAKPLTLRFDMPFWVNRTSFGTPQHFAARWLIGVRRAF